MANQPAIEDNPMGAIEQPETPDLPQIDGAKLSHRRTISGNIFSRLPFLRTGSGWERSSSSSSSPDKPNGHADSPLPPTGSLALVQQNCKIRRRKGSLRKTALLGKGVLGRDRKASDAKLKSPLSSPQFPQENDRGALTIRGADETDTDATPRPSQDEDSPLLSISPPRWTFPSSRVSSSSLRSSVPSVEPLSSRASITSPTLPTDHSTTDEDDQSLSFPKLPFLTTRKPPSSSGDSYFPPQSSSHALRLTNRTKSPLATQPQSLTSSPVASEEEWDYTETAYWGYVILIITWLVFVVGMGSCFDVWSWAWDVGETPYAPPELNDDPTLPIVGYYPALIVLTSVMAWVWVVVAWVGMKYFKHAEVRGDDG